MTRLTDPQALADFGMLKEQMGIASAPDVRICRCIASPMLAWLARPTILLPVQPLPAQERLLVYRHELIHLKRGDLLYRAALILAVAVNWFNPAVYLFARLFTLFCEMSCDEAAVENQDSQTRYRYAMTMIRLSSAQSGRGAALYALHMGGKRMLKSRISAVIDTSKKRVGTALLAACLLAAAGAGTTFAAGSVNGAGDGPGSPVAVKSHEAVKREIEEAFAEEFSREFHEENFPGAAITYDADGVPVVAAPGLRRDMAVLAAAGYDGNGFYAASGCSRGDLVFRVPEGSEVEVVDSAAFTRAAKVNYCGATGYMKKSGLRF